MSIIALKLPIFQNLS